MINFELLASFFTLCFLLAVSPGPSNAFLMAQTFAKGRRAGVQTALGFALGGVVHTVLAVVGLSALLKASATAFQVVTWCGALYLIYLGVQSIREGLKPMSPEEKPHVSQSNKNVMFQAMMTEVLNPKVALFFIAFMPQFVDPNLPNPTLQLAIFGLLYPIFAFPVDLTYVYFGDKIAAFFRHHDKAQSRLDILTGVIFILLAGNLVW